MSVLIVSCGSAGGVIGNDDSSGKYLKMYDPDAYEGFGVADWTADKSAAIHFADFLAAMAEWKRESSVRPVRDDGKPNRPLTAYNITFETVSRAAPAWQRSAARRSWLRSKAKVFTTGGMSDG